MWNGYGNCVIPTPELVTPPASEPLTLAELKLHLRVDAPDDDDQITALGVAARQWIETALDRQLVTATWRVTLPWFTGWEIELPYPPLRSVGSITYKDAGLVTRTVSPSTYDVVTTRTPGLVRPKIASAWPPTGFDPAAVMIVFDAGYGSASAVSDLVKAAIRMMVEHWYDPGRGPTSEGERKEIPFTVESIIAAARAYRF